ncbi:MAG: prepilin-type N-terminal cleavage/methylation domain-containing protein [Candidatus Falkowbacteria bacterium]
MLKYSAKKNNGFTLIELLVVIGIIGLISTIAVISLNTARSRARDVKRKTDIKTIKTALELYNSDYGKYPAAGACTYGANFLFIARVVSPGFLHLRHT